MLTVDDDLDHPEVDLSPGQDPSLAGVCALVILFDAADLKAVGRMREPHCRSSSSSRRRRDRKQEVEVKSQVTNAFAGMFG